METLTRGLKTAEGRPAILPHICIGKVVTHQRLDNGRYNIMLLGMRRARLVSMTGAPAAISTQPESVGTRRSHQARPTSL